MALTFGVDRLCTVCKGSGKRQGKATKAEESQRRKELRLAHQTYEQPPRIVCRGCAGTGLM